MVPKALNGSQDTKMYDVGGDGCRYYGITVRETSGSAAAVLRIRAGTSAADGVILDTIRLAPGESRGEWYGPQGIACPSDLWEDWVSGAYEGTVRVG